MEPVPALPMLYPCLVIEVDDIKAVVDSSNTYKLINGSNELCWSLIVGGASSSNSVVLVMATGDEIYTGSRRDGLHRGEGSCASRREAMHNAVARSSQAECRRLSVEVNDLRWFYYLHGATRWRWLCVHGTSSPGSHEDRLWYSGQKAHQ